MLDVNVSWPLQGKMWDPYFFFTSCIPSHRSGPTLSSLTPCSSLGLSFVNSCLAFQLRSAVTLYLTRTDSQREERKPLSSLIPLISQPTISSPGWVLCTCRFSILSLSFPSWHPLSLPFAPWHSVFPAQSSVCLYSSLINVWNGCLPLSALESASLCEYAPTVKGNSFYPWDSLSEKLIKVFLAMFYDWASVLTSFNELNLLSVSWLHNIFTFSTLRKQVQKAVTGLVPFKRGLGNSGPWDLISCRV